MFKKYILFVFFFLLIFLPWIYTAQAGFGISPPHIKNKQLVPGSHYEQKITLLRSSAEDDLKAEIKINAPEIESWISIDKGNDFILPKNSLQVPMIVSLDVPEKAELGNYKGHIDIKILPIENKDGGGVSIALGARIDIDLTLTNVAYADFLVRLVSIPDFELLGWPWHWKIFSKFLHKIKVVMNIENIGNVKIAPSKVTLEVYDIAKKKLLESRVDKSLKKVDSFSTKEVIAVFPTKLDAGQYWGKIKIYNGNKVVNSYEIAFTIAKKGELAQGTSKLNIWAWLLLFMYILSVIIIVFVLIKIKIWRIIKILILVNIILTKPFLPFLKKFIAIYNNIKIRFWRWISIKANKYNKDNK